MRTLVSTLSCTCYSADSSARAALRRSLEPVASAAWNDTTSDAMLVSGIAPSMCTPGTRVVILEEIIAWATASESPCVFWLNGLAGTGKSTIARTLCQRLHEQRLLGASFFVSRDQQARRDPSNIVRSIAHQLAVRWRPVSDALCDKLRETDISATRSLKEQITDFIATPAGRLGGDTSSFIIVIDALDECPTDFLSGRPGGDFLLLFVSQLLQLGGRLRLFLTSRNEVPIQHMFGELSASVQTVVKLHDLDTMVVRDDISTYLKHSFDGISTSRHDLALGNWPPAQDVEKLTELSGLLFIYAATAMRFVQNRNYHPRHRLAQLLEQGKQSTVVSSYRQLDTLYGQIMNEAAQDPESDQEFLCWRLRAVVAVIVLAYTPLNIEALVVLSGVDVENMRIVVGRLSSLLADSADCVRVFHPSFPDFAIDAARCTDPRLRVVPLVDHGTIALRCLGVMNQHLRYNICSLGDCNVANADVQDLDELLRKNVSDAVRYAAFFWCAHLSASGSPDERLLDALDNFCRRHIFHWVEVLSLLKHVPSAETALLKVMEWCEVRCSVA
jgi:hypothetical protein